jgi:RNA polymerase sigma-70 factor (ECF subfamily)
MAIREEHPNERSDRELVLFFQSGDVTAYDEIYRRYAARVGRICRTILGDGSDADEATQETFLRCYMALGRFNGQFQVGAWLARIARNICLDQLRSRSRHVRTTELSDETEELAAPNRPEMVVEEHLQISHAFRHLTPLHGEALFMRAVEGLSHSEMATRLEMSPPQVKALLHRARQSFKKAWKNAAGWSVATVLGARDMGRGTLPSFEFVHSPVTANVVERVALSAVAMTLAFSASASVPAPAHTPTQTRTVGREVASVPKVESYGLPTSKADAQPQSSLASTSVRTERREPTDDPGLALPVVIPNPPVLDLDGHQEKTKDRDEGSTENSYEQSVHQEAQTQVDATLTGVADAVSDLKDELPTP